MLAENRAISNKLIVIHEKMSKYNVIKYIMAVKKPVLSTLDNGRNIVLKNRHNTIFFVANL